MLLPRYTIDWTEFSDLFCRAKINSNCQKTMHNVCTIFQIFFFSFKIPTDSSFFLSDFFCFSIEWIKNRTNIQDEKERSLTISHLLFYRKWHKRNKCDCIFGCSNSKAFPFRWIIIDAKVFFYKLCVSTCTIAHI